ncbi:MAG: GNAT family N-acetyltransferase [Opitutaceae bacterium]
MKKRTATKKTKADKDWRKRYATKIMTAGEAVTHIKAGQRVFIGTGCAAPLDLVRALTDYAGELADVEIIHLLTFGEAPYAHTRLSESFRVNSFFISENVRSVINEGLGDYTPIFLSDIPRLFTQGEIHLDAALIQVTPPDENGMCSLGVSVDIVKSASESAELVIAAVNPHMPRTHGNSSLSIDDLDILVETDTPIIERPPVEVTPETEQIAEYIAPLIDDGSTLELGIGRIPHALMAFLKDKKDLGIHTEMITDRIVDLIKSGVVTGKFKTLDKGKVVASFCLGSRKLYDFVDDNPVFSFQPTEYVNDPFIISQQDRMVAINVALEVDLTGQVCADSIGQRFFSGVGGQVDFNRGAARSKGGKAVIALPSTARGGTVSRITSKLTSGAGVVTTRADVHYVATEYGIAYLHGKSIQERAVALICIAHPDFRAGLLREAIEAKYLSVELSDKGERFIIGPRSMRTAMNLEDGTRITFRPIHPTDEPKMRHLFYALSQQTVYYRFMRYMKRMPRKQLEDFIYVDHRNDVAIVGTIPTPAGEEIIAVGRYFLDPKTNQAEIAFTVRDDWQRKGIGTFLFKHMSRIARRYGIKGFTAEVLSENSAMLNVFNKSRLKKRSHSSGGVVSLEFDF